MINTDFRTYNYFTYGEPNKYGQPVLSEKPTGEIKMAIYLSSQTTQDSILYQDAQYVGLTRDAISDNYVIEYGDEKLKVLYINPRGRCKQVFMSRM